jgi:hypothetical protein
MTVTRWIRRLLPAYRPTLADMWLAEEFLELRA